jgi:hypothetical protein
MHIEKIWAWFLADWMRAGLIASFFLLALAPLLREVWSLPMPLVYLHLPIYMIHQGEEHIGDRIRLYINDTMGGGRDILSTVAVAVINVPGVWGIGLLTIYAAREFGIGYGLVAIYLMLFNALLHIVPAMAKRAANPGLWSASLLFLPLSSWALWEVSQQQGVTAVHHIIGITAAILLHGAIVVYVKRRMAPG